MATGKELFQRFLNGQPMGRPAFVPLVRGLASRVGGVSVEALTRDPALWANSLVKTTELFGFDGVVAGLDFTLLAEACGCRVTWRDDRPDISPPVGDICAEPECSGRLQVALDKAHRVFEVSRSQRACVAAMTGPVTLAAQLHGPDAGPDAVKEVKSLVVRVAEAFCQTRPDLLIFMEGRALGLVDITPAHRKVYNTLKNVARYFDIPVGLYLQGYDPDHLEKLNVLKMDLHVLGPSVQGGLPRVSQVWELGADSLGVGIALPLNDLSEARRIIARGAQLYHAQQGRGFFFTSHGPATREVDLEMLHELVREIAGLQL